MSPYGKFDELIWIHARDVRHDSAHVPVPSPIAMRLENENWILKIPNVLQG